MVSASKAGVAVVVAEEMVAETRTGRPVVLGRTGTTTTVVLRLDTLEEIAREMRVALAGMIVAANPRVVVGAKARITAGTARDVAGTATTPRSTGGATALFA